VERHRKFGFATLGIIGALTLTLTGCSSSGSSTTASQSAGAGAGSTAPGSTATGTPLDTATGTPLDVVQILDYAPQVGYDIQTVNGAAQAAVDYINQHGGVRNHPIHLTECMSALSVNDAVTCTNQAIANKNVVALVSTDVQEAQNIDPLLNTAKLPNIGEFPLTTSDYTSPMSFPAGAGSTATAGAALLLGEQLHLKPTRALVLSGNLSAQVAVNFSNESLAAYGLPPMSGNVGVAITQQDVTSQTVQVLQGAAGVNAIVDPGTLGRFMKERAALGLTTPVAANAAECQPCASLIAAAGAPVTNWYIADSFQPTSSNGSGMRDFRSQIAAHGLTTPDEQELYGWVGMQLFKAAAEVASAHGPVTRASLAAAFQELNNFQVPGVTPVINFTKPNTSLGGTIPRLFNPTVVFAKLNQNGTNTAITGAFVNLFQKSGS
jgi:hypothetical protein